MSLRYYLFLSHLKWILFSSQTTCHLQVAPQVLSCETKHNKALFHIWLIALFFSILTILIFQAFHKVPWFSLLSGRRPSFHRPKKAKCKRSNPELNFFSFIIFMHTCIHHSHCLHKSSGVFHLQFRPNQMELHSAFESFAFSSCFRQWESSQVQERWNGCLYILRRFKKLEFSHREPSSLTRWSLNKIMRLEHPGQSEVYLHFGYGISQNCRTCK